MTHEDVLLAELKAIGLKRLEPPQLNNLALRLIDGAEQMVDPKRFVPGRLLVTILEDRCGTGDRQDHRKGQ